MGFFDSYKPDANDVSKPYEPLPMGDYKVKIIGAKEETKDGKTKLIVEYQLTEGEHKGRKLKSFITLSGATPGGNDFGRKQLNTLVVLCNMPSKLPDGLVGKSITIHVVVKQKYNAPAGEMVNDVQLVVPAGPPNVPAPQAGGVF